VLDQRSALEPAEHPRDAELVEAARRRTSLALTGLASLLACLALTLDVTRRAGMQIARYSFDPVFSRLAGACLAILAGAFLAAALAAQARLSARRDQRSAPRSSREGEAGGSEMPPSRLRWRGRIFAAPAALARAMRGRLAPGRALAGGLPALVMLAGAGAALLMLMRDWPVLAEIRPALAVSVMRGASALIACFPLLLGERAYAGFASARLPEAPGLQRLLRLVLLVFALEGATSLLEGYGLPAAARFAPLFLRLALIVVALELILRALATFFQPLVEPALRRAPIASALAALTTPDAASSASWRQSLEDGLGIDLSRSWALQFARAAFVPVLLVLLLVAWGLTGVTVLGADQRGVYERLGRPVAVLRPGLHLGLPWPFGIVRRVDFGEVHTLPLGAPAALAEAAPPDSVGAEDAAPPSADRLWDQSHPTETSYLIASDAAARSAFQVVDVDVALIWRVGLGDEAALASLYRAAEPNAFLRAFAGRLLARYFSTRTLLGALGERREGLAEELRSELQGALDRAGTGIEHVAVAVEAIHPPAKAADSYHEVQAARIRAEAMISEARRRAVTAVGEARRVTTEKIAGAEAAASERVTLARSDALRFATDAHSFAAAGASFLFERYLGALARGFAEAPITLLDHRLAAQGNETIIDMRSFRAAAPPSVPDEDIGEKEPNK